ncbi:MAG: hypothetical protein AAB401_05145 [Acidobacteriota bacterium]
MSHPLPDKIVQVPPVAATENQRLKQSFCAARRLLTLIPVVMEISHLEANIAGLRVGQPITQPESQVSANGDPVAYAAAL